MVWVILLPIFTFGQASGDYEISVFDTTYHKIGSEFHGIQYHSNTFTSQGALERLKPLNLKLIRIWAEIRKFHPGPGVWNWDELDKKIAEISDAGYEAVPCIWGEKWFMGSADSAWWNYDSAITEWELAAYNFANRYKDKINMIILFDELNMVHSEEDYYIHFGNSAKLYLKAAKKIKEADPTILCGGPSGFLGWENGHWANYLLKEPDGAKYLDFISSNTFISFSKEDGTEKVLDRTIWYEEIPLKIREMIGDKDDPMLMLDAYNFSAVWKVGDELWTDPRNTNIIGGIYQAAALMHSAKGGFDIALRWETIGGFGILDWFPQFNPLKPYYSLKLLIEEGGLVDGAEIIGCRTNESPKGTGEHHSGMNVNLYQLQPFAVKRKDNGVTVILINKYGPDTLTASVSKPEGMKSYELFRFDEKRIENCSSSIAEGNTEEKTDVVCPPYSVTIVKYSENEIVGVEEEESEIIEEYELSQNYPNPFNPTTTIEFSVPAGEKGATSARVDIFDVLGNKIKTIYNGSAKSGKHKIAFDGSELSSGIYFYQLKSSNFVETRKMMLIK